MSQQFLASLHATILLPRAKNQMRTHFRQTLRHLAAQANRTTGNDGHAAAEIE
jgi:hypothetical protein